MAIVRRISERLARASTRRSFLGRGVSVAFGALIGAAAGSAAAGRRARAGGQFSTECQFPGPACPCDGCNPSGTCAKPCLIMTLYYASGCWYINGVTCCDCDCNGFQGHEVCGCGSDIHNDPAYCP